MPSPSSRILELLYDRREGYFLLSELASAAGADQAAVERLLHELAQRGHELEYSPTAGVRLGRPVQIDAHLIERNLLTKRVGRNVICFDEVDSTNDVAISSARQAGADGLAVLSRSQRAGRGRHGHHWISPAGANVLMSVLLVDASLPHEPLTIAGGLAVAEGITDATGVSCDLKWPNDVLLEGAKVSGVLVEVRQVQRRRCLVVGIGINVNAAPPEGGTARPATCLAQRLGHQVECIEVAQAVLRRLDAWVAAIGQGQLGQLRQRWMARCGMINERVTILRNGQRHCGRVLDVDPLEGLLLCYDSGVQAVLPAEGSNVAI